MANLRPRRSDRQADSKAKRGVAVPTTASVSRTASNANQRSIRLTVKAPPSKLREVTMGSPPDSKKLARETLSRGSKNKPTVVDRDEDDDEDEDMEQSITRGSSLKTPTAPLSKPSLSFRIPKKPGTETKKPSPESVLKSAPRVTSVENKEMALAGSDDDDLSELDDEDVEEVERSDGDQDEDEEEDEEEDEDREPASASDEDEDMSSPPPNALDQIAAAAAHTNPGGDDSDSDNFDTSQTGTPDPSKQTLRQRGGVETELMSLSNASLKKKVLTAEQQSMRKQEMARRRKDLSEKRAVTEREDTLRKLLVKAPAKKTKAQLDAELMELEGEGAEGKEIERANPAWCRTVITSEGTRVAVPDEWLEAPVGRVFGGATAVKKEYIVVRGNRLVQEVE
jgi:Ino eighty subunit 2